MSLRLKKVNKHIERILGELLPKEIDFPPEVLVTVSHAEVTPNLKSATVWLYVMPLTRGEEVLETIQADIYQLQGEFNRTIHMRQLPLLKFKLDHGADHAEKIERKLSEIT